MVLLKKSQRKPPKSQRFEIARFEIARFGFQIARFGIAKNSTHMDPKHTVWAGTSMARRGQGFGTGPGAQTRQKIYRKVYFE